MTTKLGGQVVIPKRMMMMSYDERITSGSQIVAILDPPSWFFAFSRTFENH